jgi:hypothetical protein
MYHSITFGDKNTWDDWHLVPSSRPVFNPPSVKTKIIDIPGGDGVIDLTESLTGYPVYNNREGSFEFIVVNDNYEPVDEHREWYNVYSDIMDYLHGQEITAKLEDDKNYYYKGRFAVNNWKSDKYHSLITIDYSVEPYKWLVTEENWIWNTFSFETGVIRSKIFDNVAISTTYVNKTLTQDFYGRAPVSPTFVISTTSKKGASIRFVNTTLGIDITKTLPDGSTQDSDFVMYGSEVTLYLKAVSGTGTVTLSFVPGRL